VPGNAGVKLDYRPVPLVPVVVEVPVVPVVPVVPLPQVPVPDVVPVELVVGVLPVAPVVGLPRSVMAPVPLVVEPDELAPLFMEPDELVPDVLPIESVDLQAARLRPIEAARMMLSVVRFIFFSLHIGLRSSSCERPLATAIGRYRQDV
jgi:hypothetical protein